MFLSENVDYYGVAEGNEVLLLAGVAELLTGSLYLVLFDFK